MSTAIWLFSFVALLLIIGIVVGMMLVNWAIRRKVIAQIAPFSERSSQLRCGIYPPFRCPLADPGFIIIRHYAGGSR